MFLKRIACALAMGSAGLNPAADAACAVQLPRWPSTAFYLAMRTWYKR